MAQNEQKLPELIKSIEKNATPLNMEIIYKNLKSLANNEAKLKKHLPEAKKLISLIGTYLVKGEGLNTTESQLIFDHFCNLDFMSLLVKYSSFNFYEINLEIITTFSFLMINIKSTTYLYYFFSKNLLNKIINQDYSKYDEEFLSYYVNFLKSLSLRLDEVSIQLFYIEKTNNFPIIENVIKLYNHRDSMVRNVVRNIVLNILKIKNPKIQDHFTELPSISYLANIACHLRDICLQINDEVAKKKISNLSYLYDDLIDEATYIDDLLNLNLTKINYIIINCLFYHLILPFICGSICEKTNRISKHVSLFLIIFFFVNMKNEIFKNCLFSLLFLDKLSTDLEFFFDIPPEKNNYSFNANDKKNITFCDFISENYSSRFLLTMIEDDNIIYNKYKNKYHEIEEIMKKCKGIYQKLITSKNKTLFVDIKERLEMVISSFFSEEESNKMSQYHRNLSMSTGLGVGQFSKEGTGEIYNICFLCSINQIFVDLKEGQKDENSSLVIYANNIIKEGLNKIIENLNENNLEMILLVNMIIFVVQNKETNISNNLLRHVGLENIKEKVAVRESLIKNVFNIFSGKKQDNDSPLSELCLNNNNFNFNNDYFSITKDSKYLIFNTIKLPFLLSKHLLLKHKNIENKEEQNNNNKDKEENIIQDKDIKINEMNIYLLPMTYKLILCNIMNLSINSSNKFELKKEKQYYDIFVNNIEKIYSQIIVTIAELIEQNKKYREQGYNIFFKKWKIYKKTINSKNIIDIIRDEIMNTTFLLLPNEYENCKEIEYPDEISRKQSNIKDNFFNNCLLNFMMIHDLREILISNANLSRYSNSNRLIKNYFPLYNNKNNALRFKVNTEWNLEKINYKQIFRENVSFKFSEEEQFIEGEIILFRQYLYLTTKIRRNLVKINFRIKIKLTNMYKKFDNKNIINFLIEKYDKKKNKNENDNDEDEDDDDDDEDEGKNNEIEKKNLNVSVQFKDEKTRENTVQFINDKILSMENEERLLFNDYFKGMSNNIKNIDEDF